jgi:hypothetical protein
MRRPSMLTVAPPEAGPKAAVWVYWRFSAEHLAELKASASRGQDWVSTNDALTAFFVQRLTAIRIEAGRVAADEPIHLDRAVNSRPILDPPVSGGFMGHMVSPSTTKWATAQDLCSASLADAALKMRESLKRLDDRFVRSLATLINDTEDKTTIFYGAMNKPGRDFMSSSWAQLHWLSHSDFGKGLGAPEMVRRARMTPLPDLSYILPKNKRGDMYIATCLFHEDFAGLVNDETWKKRAHFVG